MGGVTGRPATLLAVIRTSMPPGLDGSLSDGEYLDIVAYILKANGHPAGNQPLAANAAVLIGAGRRRIAERPVVAGSGGRPDAASWEQ